MAITIQQVDYENFLYNGDINSRSFRALSVGDYISIISDGAKANNLVNEVYYKNFIVKDFEGTILVDGTASGTIDDIVKNINTIVNRNNSPVDVNLQDQITDSVIIPLVNLIGSTSLTSEAIEDTKSINVSDSTGMVIGQHVRILNTKGDRYYAGTILGVVGNAVTLDSLIDYPYTALSEVTFGNINMAVDGSLTPACFCLRTGSPSVPSDLDITRFIITCQCSTAVDLNSFGDLPPLTNGILFRHVGDYKRNIFNVKTNGDLASIAFDWTPHIASNPAQAVDGFVCRLTFAGQNKIGVAIRVASDGQIQAIVEDDLSDLISLTITAEGHVTENY